MDFSTRLRMLRESKKLSQEELANKLGIPRSTITNLEKSDGSRLPRKERLEKIADFFGVSLDYLLGRVVNVFGQRLKEFRLHSDMSLLDLSEKSGLDESHIDSLEKGQVSPSKKEIIALAKALGADRDDLLVLAGFAPYNLDEDIFQRDTKGSTQVFSSRLIGNMDKKGLTEEEVAEFCGVTPEYIKKLERNPDKLPGVSTLYKLAELFEVTPDFLGGFVDDPQGRSPHTPKPRDLKEIMENQEVLFDGVPMSEADRQKVLGFMEAMFWDAKQKNKRKK